MFGHDSDRLQQEAALNDAYIAAQQAAADYAAAEAARIVLKRSDFKHTADEFLSRCADHGTIYRYWRGTFYVYRLNHYEPLSNDLFETKVLGFLNAAEVRVLNKTTGIYEFEPYLPNNTHISNVVTQLRAACSLADDQQLGGWIGRDDAHDWIALRNGIFRISDQTLYSYSPEFFGLGVSNFDLLPKHESRCPAWLKFVQEIFPDDVEAQTTLQETLGYLTSSDTSLHKIMVLTGAPRSGKSTILRVLKQLIGETNYGASDLVALGSRFGLAPLVGKKICAIADANMHSNYESATAAERMKNISGEDTVDIDRKNRDTIAMQLTARIILASNEVPRLKDASGVIAQRMVLLKFGVSFTGREDHGLGARLGRELSGIFWWAMEGYLRLKERGRFLMPESSKEAIEDVEDAADDVIGFVRDCCKVERGLSISTLQLYVTYTAWTKQHGMNTQDSARFGRSLKAAFPTVKKWKPRDASGKQVREYQNIGLNS
ncbi:DNA primase family protein [Bosea sp. NPDC055353]